MVWVPLEPYVGSLHGRLPRFSGGVFIGVVAGGDFLVVDFVEKRPFDPHSQDDFLPLFGSPAGAIHHPEKIRFDPAHPGVEKIAAEILMFGREEADAWAIGLVDDDGGVVVLGEDVTAVLGPALVLCGVKFCSHLFILE